MNCPRIPLTLPCNAEETINPHRFVKFGATAGKYAQASAATDKVLGVSDYLGVVYDSALARNDIDVHVIGAPQLQVGGAVAAGDKLTADADGKGVVAAAGNLVYAMANAAGVAGDIIEVILMPGSTVL
jgi:hypothetical protein